MNPRRISRRSFRFSLLLAAAGLISMGIFAMVPLLLCQTSDSPRFPRASYARLIPVRPEVPPDPIQPQRAPEAPPEEPPAPEQEMKTEMPELPEIEPPEPEAPESTPPEVIQATLDRSPLAAPAPEVPSLDLPRLQTVSLSAPPMQSSSMNLKVNLKVGKAPAPKAMARHTLPKRTAPTKSRFGLDELDQKPVGLATLKPRYPFRAKRLGIQGYVTVQFLVDRKGRARELTIVKADPEGVFEQSVRQTVPRWRFKPGKKAGRAVDTWVEMTIRFELGRDG